VRVAEAAASPQRHTSLAAGGQAADYPGGRQGEGRGDGVRGQHLMSSTATPTLCHSPKFQILECDLNSLNFKTFYQ
jgi:hypothetical protein